VRDRSDIDAELRLPAAVRRSIREHGNEPTSQQADEPLDERLTGGGESAPNQGSTDASGGTAELRVLLSRYDRLLEQIDNGPRVLWTKPGEALPWLRFPAPRALVRTLLLRHLSRCVAALKRSGARRVAVAENPSVAERDLKALELFEQSLPNPLRLSIVAPLALVGTTLVAYALANYWIQTPSRKLLGDLTSAAFQLDRSAAVDAFKNNHLPGGFYVGAAVVLAWSVTLVILPLLPAFSVKRRLLQAASRLEARGFAALGTGRVHDLELDLLALQLLVLPVAAFGINSPIYNSHSPPGERQIAMWATVGLVMICLSALATVELHSRFALRRGATAVRWHGGITRISLRLVCAWSILVLSLTFYLHR
jgi:hypothetical protein